MVGYNKWEMYTRKSQYQTKVIGSLAYELLSGEKKAHLFSQISKGIFIKLSNNKLVYISFENFRGPLTINLSAPEVTLPVLSQGEPIIISRGELWFPEAGISFLSDAAEIWYPSQITATPLTKEKRKALIRELAKEAIHQTDPASPSLIYPKLFNFSNIDAFGENKYSGIAGDIDAIKNKLKLRNDPSLITNLKSLLGKGSGLTPSGDDFILGLFLALNRWETILKPRVDLPALNQSIIRAAYQTTTSLSADLIECACLGLADERLISAVDFLAVGNQHLLEVLSGLLSWGNSSGIDALVGMMTAILATCNG